MTKTEFLLILAQGKGYPSNLPANPNFVINDIPVKQVSVSAKSLGVKIDQNLQLNWENHNHITSKKISSGRSVIKRIRYS